MRLLVLTSGLELSTLDPVAAWMHALTSRLAAGGHRVNVLCTGAEDPPGPGTDPAGVDVQRPTAEGLETALASALESGPDVVHVAGAGGLDAASIRRLDRASLLLDLVDWSPLCPATDLLLRPSDVECTRHFPVAPCGDCVGHAHVRALEPFMALARSGHRVVAHSAQARDRATLALGRGVALLPVGVDLLQYSVEPLAPLAPEVAALAAERAQPRVVLLGPPTPARGAHRLLDLIVAVNARVPGAEFVVAGSDSGDPDSTDMLLAQAKELGIAGQLRLVPRVSSGDLPALLAACDLGLAPGLAPDPLGLALVQALAAGLPVAAHPVGAAPELLRQGEAGLLADASQAGLFADQVAALLNDPASRAAYREKGRLAALEHHDLDRALFHTEALYERVRAPRPRHILGAPSGPRSAAA